MKKFSTKDKLMIVAAAAIVIIVAVLAFYLGRGCGSDGPPIVIEKPDVSIDAGGVDRNAKQQADESEAEAQEEIRKLEQAHAEDLDHFDDAQRQEYERIKKQGPDEVARWLSDFNKDIRHGE